MKIFSQDLVSSFKSSAASSSRYARFTVYGYWVDSSGQEQTTGITVTITATGYTQVGNYIDVPVGTRVGYTISRQGYEDAGPYYRTVTGNSTVSVEITSLAMYQLIIDPTPADATVSLRSGQYENEPGAKTILVPQGSSVTCSISRAGMNSDSFTRLVPASETETSPITVNRTLTSTITINSITPQNAEISWSTGSGDPFGGLTSGAVPCTQTVDLTITKIGYDTIHRKFPESGLYLLNQNLGDIAMVPSVIPATITCNEPTAEIAVWKEINGVEVAGTRQTGYSSVSIDCNLGDDIHWTATKQNYTAIPGSHVIDENDATNGQYVASPIIITVNNYVATINVSPAIAVVVVYAGATEIARSQPGVGGVSVGVDSGTSITYTSTLGGVTVSGSGTVTDGPYTDTLVLSSTSGGTVALIENSQTITLPYGRYKAILVGGGAGGEDSFAAYYGPRSRTAASGGRGGGSGYATIEEFVVSNVNGQTVYCAVGDGGVANGNGGDTSITVGGVTYSALGGGSSTTVGDGGSGGGSLGCGQYAGQIQTDSCAGGSGSYGGGNGESTSHHNYGTGRTTTYAGGTGFYNTVKSYENNGGGLPSGQDVDGTPGGGGRGLVTMSANLLTPSYFMSLASVQTLYNSLGGGGGGGPSGVPTSSAITIYGGGGGGGGGWQAGSVGSVLDGGAGGKGAILYMRIAWS